MKFTVHKLRVGDIVSAQVIEVVNLNECIVSFYGDLIRVSNQSNQKLKKLRQSIGASYDNFSTDLSNDRRHFSSQTKSNQSVDLE